MIQREAPDDTALVLHPDFGGSDILRIEARLEEAAGLAEALGLRVVDVRSEPVRKLEPSRRPFHPGTLLAVAAGLSPTDAHASRWDAYSSQAALA